jgi:hypothetical protein
MPYHVATKLMPECELFEKVYGKAMESFATDVIFCYSPSKR